MVSGITQNAGYFKSGSLKRLGKISTTKTQVLVLIWAAFQQQLRKRARSFHAEGVA
jgi:hypothetical protein